MPAIRSSQRRWPPRPPPDSCLVGRCSGSFGVGWPPSRPSVVPKTCYASALSGILLTRGPPWLKSRLIFHSSLTVATLGTVSVEKRMTV